MIKTLFLKYVIVIYSILKIIQHEFKKMPIISRFTLKKSPDSAVCLWLTTGCFNNDSRLISVDKNGEYYIYTSSIGLTITDAEKINNNTKKIRRVYP